MYVNINKFYKNKVYKTYYDEKEQVKYYKYDLCKFDVCNNNCTYIHKLQLKRKRDDDIEYYKNENVKIIKDYNKINNKLIKLENDKLNLQSDNNILRNSINEYKIKMIRINSFFDSKVDSKVDSKDIFNKI